MKITIRPWRRDAWRWQLREWLWWAGIVTILIGAIALGWSSR